MENLILLGYLEGVLGKSQKRAKENYAFKCPFPGCKKDGAHKLEVKLETNLKGENPWECWRCKKRGKTIKSLLIQLHLPGEKQEQILKCVPHSNRNYVAPTTKLLTHLPNEFKPLIGSNTILARKAKNYLSKRGIGVRELLRYNIGYASEGKYEGRIILPSYDNNNQLNYFTARTFTDQWPKYDNPDVSRDVVIFENQINWSLPIVITEGYFDAIAVRRNATPSMGTAIQDALMQKIIEEEVEDIYIAWDPDAKKLAMKYCEEFVSMGKRVFFLDLKKNDPSKMGFVSFTEQARKTKQLTLSDIVRFKLSYV